MDQIDNHDLSQRRFPRKAFQKTVGVLHKGRYFLAQSEEIGEGGMSLLLPEPIGDKEEVVISFHVPGSDFVALRAVMINKRENGSQTIFGFGFKNISFERKREIRSFVSSRS